MALLRSARSVLSLLLCLTVLASSGLVLYPLLVPASWLWPRRRLAIVSGYMKAMSRLLLGSLELGGASFSVSGRVPTGEPALLVGNHQSLVDILIVNMLADPYVPAFVTRRRYARFVPLVSCCVQMLRCPVIDPRRDPRGAVATITEKARSLEHGLIIFPEGHRSLDGEVRPFRAAGLLAILGERRLPVHLVVSDGLWHCRRFVDFALGVHLMRGRTEVLGPFEPPHDTSRLPAFVEDLRTRLIDRLRAMRGEGR